MAEPTRLLARLREPWPEDARVRALSIEVMDGAWYMFLRAANGDVAHDGKRRSLCRLPETGRVKWRRTKRPARKRRRRRVASSKMAGPARTRRPRRGVRSPNHQIARSARGSRAGFPRLWAGADRAACKHWTVASWLDEWKTRTTKTTNGNSQAFRDNKSAHIKHHLGSKLLTELREADVRTLVNTTLAKRHCGMDPLAPQTRDHVCTTCCMPRCAGPCSMKRWRCHATVSRAPISRLTHRGSAGLRDRAA